MVRLIVRRIVLERAIGSAVKVLELTRAERPQEGRKADAAEQQRHRNQPGERGHDRPLPARRAALRVTRMEEVDMTMAAISGVTRPAMANGTQTAL